MTNDKYFPVAYLIGCFWVWGWVGGAVVAHTNHILDDRHKKSLEFEISLLVLYGSIRLELDECLLILV